MSYTFNICNVVIYLRTEQAAEAHIRQKPPQDSIEPESQRSEGHYSETSRDEMIFLDLLNRH
ncbi:hypothetical protein EYZ11_013261 [Aspergillus tanneri]|uniref:Uncharacterized protein n=1 Tax=Aspergillus tanneri TaxID=1220188 RepID=A0A4S3IYM1_9EURO|nr:hypothetical protein EYZ11_013261 [Aspergillus tanneri]